MIVVRSAVTRTWRARPSCSRVMVSIVAPECLTAPSRRSWWRCPRACAAAGRRSPGARVTTHWNTPLTWFCTSMLSAGPSMFSATMTSGRGARITLSSSGMSWAILVIFSFVSRMYGSSSTASRLAGFVTMYGETKPLSNSNPSTKATLMPGVDDSSIVTMPASPTVNSASREHRADGVVVVGRDRRDAGVVGLRHDGPGHAAQVLHEPRRPRGRSRA